MFLFSAALLIALVATTPVPPLPIDVRPPEMPAAEQEELKRQARQILLEIEANAPRFLHFECDRPQTKQAALPQPRHTSVAIARQGNQLLYKFTVSVNGFTSSAYGFDGASHRLLESEGTPDYPAAAIIVEDEIEYSELLLYSSGLQYVPAFTCFQPGGTRTVGFTETFRVMEEGGNGDWEVVELTDEFLVLRISVRTGYTIIVGLDRSRGGNIIRWDRVNRWGTGKAQYASRLTAYELIQFEDHWVPAKLVFHQGREEDPRVTAYSYTWKSIDAPFSTADFTITFPTGAAVRDETSVARRAARARAQTTQFMMDVNAAVWNYFD